ncbi:MAG: DUF1285 domain-containing protein [Rhodospirillaceae bacterium]
MPLQIRSPCVSVPPLGPVHWAPEGLPKGIPINSHPEGGICQSFDIRIGRDGTWYYRGSPINRHEMVCLFAQVLQRREDGSYWLITPTESGTIEVDDVPFVAVELFISTPAASEQILSFRINTDEIITAGPEHPIRVSIDPVTREPSPYVEVRPGLEARMTRPVYYELVASGVAQEGPDGVRYGVWSKGAFFSLGEMDWDETGSEGH